MPPMAGRMDAPTTHSGHTTPPQRMDVRSHAVRKSSSTLPLADARTLARRGSSCWLDHWGATGFGVGRHWATSGADWGNVAFPRRPKVWDCARGSLPGSSAYPPVHRVPRRHYASKNRYRISKNRYRIIHHTCFHKRLSKFVPSLTEPKVLPPSSRLFTRPRPLSVWPWERSHARPDGLCS